MHHAISHNTDILLLENMRKGLATWLGTTNGR